MMTVTPYSNLVVPNAECPKCGSPLVVRVKKLNDRGYIERNPLLSHFIGCQSYFATGCRYKTKFTEAIMLELDQPVEVEVDF